MVKKIYIPFIVFLAIIYNINIIRPTVIGYLVDLFTKQDKSQEINSQGNSGVNMKNNNGVINQNTYNTYNIYPSTPPVLNVAKKINNLYDLYVTLKMLTNFFKNNLEGELFKFQDFTHTPKAQRSINE
ncbi:hypothetical protein [uncultured Gammaproteobacteria bacterium]|jgi:hypothetical protein|nr:hypothetical protein [uncultured Gammaproteobacteria bacterium]CAC9512091.1 hypothetical protein [uncultured Gammaproteobacteria bacterium]VVH59316.1 hypothetical protein BAZOLSSOX_2312 [uncultured Gammaproteobacteria bacterium]